MPRSLLWLALLCHVVFATSHALATPCCEGPDENDHYTYAWIVANAGRLPLSPGLAAARSLPVTDGAALAHHPPLYYLLLAGVLTASGRDDTVLAAALNPAFGDPQQASRYLKFRHGSGQGEGPLRALRLVSVLLGAITLWLVHRLARVLCPAQPRIADLAALLIACLPMWSFLHGVLNSDVLATTLSAATTLALVRLLQADTVRAAHGVRLGTLLGLAWLTKLTTLFLGVLTAAVFVVVFVRRRRVGRSGEVWRAAAWTASLTLLLAGWWFVRNQLLYGDPLGLSVHDEGFPLIPPEYRWNWLTRSFPATVFSSLLGRFGWFILPPYPALMWLATGVAVAALFGLGLALRASERHRADAHAPRSLWLLLAAMTLVFAGTAHFNWTAPQPQARLLFPAIGPAAIVLAAGLVRLSTTWRRRRWLVALLPATTAVVFFAWYRPAFDPALAPADPSHRTFVGGIVDDLGPMGIRWREPLPTVPCTSPPSLHWDEADAPAGARYTLYVYDGHGRVWMATHEWGGDRLVLDQGSVQLPELVFAQLPTGVDVLLKLRRVPSTADEDPTMLPTSPPLPFRRG